MTKTEKIAALATAITQSERDGNAEDNFYHFTDDAPEELKSLYLEHYEVRDIDYETFSRACDIVAEVYENEHSDTDDEALERAYEAAADSASIMTYRRLQYLDNWNESEVGEIMREYDLRSVAEGAAVWYGRQVEEAAAIIVDWVRA